MTNFSLVGEGIISTIVAHHVELAVGAQDFECIYS